MRAYTNMPTNEFVEQLRDIACKAGARAVVIDQIDALLDLSSEDEVAEEMEKAIKEAETEFHGIGYAAGMEDKDLAAEEAAKEMYDSICATVEKRSEEIGLTPEQVDKVINHIIWDCRP